jgi:hypothetical protein
MFKSSIYIAYTSNSGIKLAKFDYLTTHRILINLLQNNNAYKWLQKLELMASAALVA